MNKDLTPEAQRNCKIHSVYMITADSKESTMYSITVKTVDSKTILRDGFSHITTLASKQSHEYLFYGHQLNSDETVNLVIQRSLLMNHTELLPTV